MTFVWNPLANNGRGGLDEIGTTISSYVSELVALKVTTSGSDTYVAVAPIGSAQSSAVWQAQKVTVSGLDVTITWADSGKFSQVATDLSLLSYS